MLEIKVFPNFLNCHCTTSTLDVWKLSPSKRSRGVRILKAVSSSVRLKILDLLFKGPFSYTELMTALKMNPSRDAGRFAYHLKFLLKEDLIEADVDTKKYQLTELGKMVVNVSDEIERKAAKRKRILVRTSRFTLEDFDPNKIVDSLMHEAGMPADQAQRVAKETEKRLMKSKTKYLTAPLIREVVNAILIEKGLEIYRHKLTRLGLPVHDVVSLIQSRRRNPKSSAFIDQRVAEIVLEEYVLLDTFPRDIADAHLSGELHIDCLSDWVLRPNTVVHDLRFFLQNGLDLERFNILQPSCPSPIDFESALYTILNVLLHFQKEISRTQTLEYFNVLLAPFAKGRTTAELEEALALLISQISQHVKTTLGLELSIPDFLAEEEATGPGGKPVGTYGDFKEESKLIASLVLKTIADKSSQKPLFNPKMIVKIRPDAFANKETVDILLETHKLASEKGIPHFANLLDKTEKFNAFSASGFKLMSDSKKNWPIDTLRTGNLGYVTINLPRIALECESDETRFFDILGERLEMAARALEIKYRALRKRGGSLLQLITQKSEGDPYYRLELASRLTNFAGLREASEALCGKTLSEDTEVLKFVEKLTQYVLDFTRKAGKRRRRRLLPAILPGSEASQRLARIDVERYGVAKIRFSGTRERPYYSTVNRLNLQGKKIDLETLRLEKGIRSMQTGGSMTIMHLGEDEYRPDELLSLTKRFAEKYRVKFFTYHRNLIYCTKCKKSWIGPARRCPSCGSTTTLAKLKGGSDFS